MINRESCVLGTRVICTRDNTCGNNLVHNGLTGTIVDISSLYDFDQVGIQWDEWVDGHDVSGNAKMGYGWYVGINSVSLYQPEECDIEYDYTDADILEFLTV